MTDYTGVELSLLVMDKVLQAGINADFDMRMEQWMRGTVSTRRSQAQRWRWLEVNIAEQMEGRFNE